MTQEDQLLLECLDLLRAQHTGKDYEKEKRVVLLDKLEYWLRLRAFPDWVSPGCGAAIEGFKP